MDKKTSLIQNFINSRIWRKKWARVGGVMAAMVVFVTVYSLVLPAVTLTDELYCGIEEHVEHVDSCYERELACELDESVLHQHTDACYELQSVLTCGEQEHPAHTHGDACYQSVEEYICGQEEGEEHTHTSECVQVHAELVCGQEASEGHEHTDGCYELQPVPVCGLEEGQPEHTHADDCYKKNLICEQQLHTHTLQCFSNPDADVEDAEIWERTVSAVTLTGSNAEDLVNIAGTQVGYHESADNFYVDADGTAQGWNRYGAWFGDAYDPWNEEFVYFCMHFAGIPADAFPRLNSVEELQKELGDRYHKAGTYSPKLGDIIFVSTEQLDKAERIGIVMELITGEDGTLAGVRVIEGDKDEAVTQTEYLAGDNHIVGFAQLPENPEYIENKEEAPEAEQVGEIVEEKQEETEEEVEEEIEEKAEEEIDSKEEIEDLDEYDGLYTEEELAALNSPHPMASTRIIPPAGEETGFFQSVKRLLGGLMRSNVMVLNEVEEEEENDERVVEFPWAFDAYYIQQEDRHEMEVSGSFEVRYQMKFHTDGDIPAGDVTITIPTTILTARSGGAPLRFKELGIPYGTPSNPTPARPSPFNYYTKTIDGVEYLVFFNYKDIRAGTNASWQVYYPVSYSMRYASGSTWNLEAKATVKGDENAKTANLKGTILVTPDPVIENKLLRLTKSKASGVKKSFPILYTEEDVTGLIGTPGTPLDFEHYVYVGWNVSTSLSYSDAWQLFMKEEPYFVDGEEKVFGTVIGIKGSGIPVFQEEGNYAGTYKVASSGENGKPSSSESYSYTVVTAYPKEKLIPGGTMLHNDAWMTMHMVDDENTDKDRTLYAHDQVLYKEYVYSWLGGSRLKLDKTPSSHSFPAFSEIYKMVSDFGKPEGESGEDYGSVESHITSSFRADVTSHRTELPNLGQYIPGTWATVSTTDTHQEVKVIDGTGVDVEPVQLTKDDCYFKKVSVSSTDQARNYWTDYRIGPTSDAVLAEAGTELDRSLKIYTKNFYTRDEEGNLIKDNSDEWVCIKEVPWEASGRMFYTFSEDDLALQPYLVKAEHVTVDETNIDISLVTTIRHDSPVFQKLYTNGAKELALVNYAHTDFKLGASKENYFWGKDVVDSDSATDSSTAVLQSLHESATATKNGTIRNNVAAGQFDLTYTLSAYEGYNVGGSGNVPYFTNLGFDTLVNRKHVEFYDLLPEDVQFDASKPITAKRSNGSAAQTSVHVKDIIPNWRDTGRTMVVFAVDFSGADASYTEGGFWRAGYEISFGAYTRWEEARETLVERNIAAYMPASGDTKALVGIPDTQVAKDDGVIKPASLESIMAPFKTGGGNLNNDDDTTTYNVLYASKDVIVPDVPIASNSSITAEVKAVEDAMMSFADTTIVNPGAQYLYKVTVQNMDDVRMDNLVIFQRLENADVDRKGMEPGKEFDSEVWHGTFQEVDLTDAISKGFEPVVYYSANRDAKIPAIKDESGTSVLTPENGWYTDRSQIPGGVVCAVAVDLTKGKNDQPMSLVAGVKGQPDTVSVGILMRAPEGDVDPNQVHTYHNPAFASSSMGADSCVIGDSVTVLLAKPGVFTLEKMVNAPEARQNDSFRFRITTSEGVRYAHKLYKLYTGEAYELKATDENGELTLKDGQRAVFENLGASVLKAEELDAGFFWRVTEKPTENGLAVYNDWHPPLYLRKELQGQNRFEIGNNDFVFYYKVERMENGTRKPLANEKVWSVPKVNTTSYVQPVATEHGTTNELGVLAIKSGEILVVKPGFIGDTYVVTEVADMEGTPIDPEATWQPLDSGTKTGTLGVYGSEEVFTNVKIYKSVFLKKELGHQNPELCPTEFVFKLEVKTGEQWGPAKNVQWYSYETTAQAAQNASVNDGKTDDNGCLIVKAGRLVELRDLPVGSYRLTEQGPQDTTLADAYQLIRWKADVPYTKYDGEGGKGVEFDLTVKNTDAMATFSNDYRYRDLMVEKQVISENKLNPAEIFTMILSKANGADDYQPVADQPYTVKNNLGEEVSSGKTDEEGRFAIGPSQTAVFTEVGLVGEKFRVIEQNNGNQLMPRDKAPLDLEITENGASGKFVNGSMDMIQIVKTWTPQDDMARAWVTSGGADKLGVRILVEIKRNDEDKFIPANPSHKCVLRLITADGVGEPIELTDGKYDFLDPVNGTLVLQSQDETWKLWEYRITETALDATTNEEDPLQADLIATVNDKPYVMHMDKVVSEAEGKVSGNAEGTVAGDSVAELKNSISSTEITWIKKFTTNSSAVDERTKLAWRVERYTGSQWVPAAGVEYVVSYNTEDVYDSGSFHTDGSGMIYLTGDPAQNDPNPPTPEAYAVAVGFYVPVKLDCTTDMVQGDYRVVEVEAETDPAWGKLIAYADAAGNYKLGAVTENPAGFVNDPAVKVIRLEKKMVNGAVGEGPFRFELTKVLNGRAMKGANLPYELHLTSDDSLISEGVTDPEGVVSFRSGEYALITFAENVKWIINEVPSYPYYIGNVEVTQGSGVSGDTNVQISAGTYLTDGTTLRNLLPDSTREIIFAYDGDVVLDESFEPLGNANDREGGVPINVYRQGDKVYVVSAASIIANPDSSNMFHGLTDLERVDFKNLDLSTANRLDNMFNGCNSLTSNPLAGKNLSGAVSLKSLFAGCTNLNAVNMTGMSLNNITNTSGMFSGCIGLEQVNLSDLTTGGITNADYMFYGCTNLKQIKANDWTGNEHIRQAENVFTGCKVLKGDIPFETGKTGGQFCTPNNGYFVSEIVIPTPDPVPDPSEIGKMRYTGTQINNNLLPKSTLKRAYFALTEAYPDIDLTKCTSLNETDTLFLYIDEAREDAFFLAKAHKDWLSFTDMSRLFSDCKSLESVDIADMNSTNVTTLSYIFQNCENLQSLDLNKLDTSSVTSMVGMFNGCTALEEVKVANFKTGRVTSFYGMFENCVALENVDVLNFDTSSATSFEYMFYHCDSLTELDLSRWNTANLEKANWMFAYDKKLKTLNLSSWVMDREVSGQYGSTYKFTGARNMFLSCENLETIYAQDWATKNWYLTSKMLGGFSSGALGMFSSCYKLKGDVAYADHSSSYGEMAKPVNGYFTMPKSTAENVMIRSFYEIGERVSGSTAFIADVRGGYDTVTTNGQMRLQLDRDGRIKLYTYNGTAYLLADSAEDWKMISNCDGMLKVCSNLKTIEFRNFDTSNVTSMKEMFYRCTNVTSLDLSSFNFRKLEECSEMFYGCSSLEMICALDELRGSGTDVFYNCFKLSGIPGVGRDFDIFKTDVTYGRVVDGYFSSPGGMIKPLSDLGAYIKQSGNKKIHFGTLDDFGFNKADIQTMFDGNIGLIESGENLYALTESAGEWMDYNSYARLFYGCDSIESVEFKSVQMNLVTSMERMFEGCSNLQSVDLNNSTSRKVQNMSYMFYRCPKLMEVKMGSLNTESVTKMNDVFYGCGSLTSLDIGSWNTSNVTDMSWMFYNCSSLTTLDINGWDTSSVTTLYYTFSRCSSLTTLDLNGWDTSSVTTMYSTFYNCSSLTTLDINGWDTSSVTNMYYTFKDCSSLTTLDINDWDTSSVWNMSSTFSGCSSLTSLNVGSWNTSNVSTMNSTFQGCSSLTTLNIGDWNTSNVTDMYSTFSGCSSLTTLNIGSWNTSNVRDMSAMFSDCSSLTSLNVGDWNISAVQYMSSMFSGCRSLTTLDVSQWGSNTWHVSYMNSMFQDCASLTELNLSSWDTGNVSDMSSMFEGCTGLKNLTLNYWNVTYAYRMSGMFKNCSGLTELDLRTWTECSIYDHSSMFQDCSSLEILHLESFTASYDGYVSSMFENCYKLKRIYAGDWATGLAATRGYGEDVFKNCYALIGSVPYDANNTDYTFCTPEKGGYFSGPEANLKKLEVEIPSIGGMCTYYYINEYGMYTVPENQRGVTVTIINGEDKAGISNDGNSGWLSWYESTPVGATITVRITSTYNPDIFVEKTITRTKYMVTGMPGYSGVWVDSGEKEDGFAVYTSENAGSYGTRGACIKVTGYDSVTIKVKSEKGNSVTLYDVDSTYSSRYWCYSGQYEQYTYDNLYGGEHNIYLTAYADWDGTTGVYFYIDENLSYIDENLSY